MTEKIVVSVNEGQIRGIKQVSKFSGTEFYSFFGIPYGKPPKNNLRFKDPIRVKPWKDVYDGTDEKPGCVQFTFFTCEILGTEDCLFNNIHTTKLPAKSEPLRPVIVNIHPGAYMFGSPHTKTFGSPEFIMHHNVVYVNISYRLHILGFLNLRLKECSGNQGIKDIVLSLRWIKDNIRSFGGDPDNITLLGSSSGAEIVHILMLTPASKGLFHKAVLMGGYINNPPLSHHETNECYAREIATDLGYKGNLLDHNKLLLFLKKQDPVLLIERSRKCQKSLHETIAPILPVSVFTTTIDQGDIFPVSPRKLIKSMARIPIIIGFSQIESIMGFVRRMRPLTEKHFKTSFRQNRFSWGYHLGDDDVHAINEEVEAFYCNGQPVEQAPLSIKMDIQTDIVLSDVYDAVVDPIAAELPSSVFVYKFEFEGNLQSMNMFFKDMIDETIKGTHHASDYCYWSRFSDPQDKDAIHMVQTFTKLITTFAKKGDPNYEDFPVKWRPSTLENPNYLSINKTLSMVDGRLNNDRLEFWHNVKRKFMKENHDQ